MLPQTKTIISKLTDWKIPIRRQYVDDNVEYICTDFMIISCNPRDPRNIGLLFNVCSKPDDAARVVLDLNHLKTVDDIFIDDVFVYVNDFNNIVTGKEAMVVFEQELKRMAVNEFVTDQQQMSILKNCEDCPEC
ncbi:hypothetical protein KAR91_25050 [Candidatus Pacearchaeota archaeon]|nr:hypothetical protein [Candidatus Pacearchaeota archaeon]